MTQESFNVRVYHLRAPNVSEDAHVVPFGITVEQTNDLNVEMRSVTLRGSIIRLENYEKKDDYHLLNFSKSKYSGPGRLSPTSSISRFDLRQDDYFATETAMLYDQRTHLVFLEQGDALVAAGTVCDYLRRFDQQNHRYSLEPRLDPEATARARQFGTYRKVTMQVTLGSITSEDERVGLAIVRALGENYDAATADITLSASVERQSWLRTGPVKRLIDWVSPDDENSAITGLKVDGREHDDEDFTDIDLFGQFERRRLSLAVDGSTRNVPFADRWGALEEIMEEFRAL